MWCKDILPAVLGLVNEYFGRNIDIQQPNFINEISAFT
jgi:hypothetical protein